MYPVSFWSSLLTWPTSLSVSIRHKIHHVLKYRLWWKYYFTLINYQPKECRYIFTIHLTILKIRGSIQICSKPTSSCLLHYQSHLCVMPSWLNYGYKVWRKCHYQKSCFINLRFSCAAQCSDIKTIYPPNILKTLCANTQKNAHALEYVAPGT